MNFYVCHEDTFINNIYATKDYTYHDLCCMIQNKYFVFVKGSKNYTIAIMKKSGRVKEHVKRTIAN